jgi:predicted TIM-barrel fold metal-dependent hydrolase
MTYANGRVIHDADSHVMETRDWLTPFVDDTAAGALRSLFGKAPNPIDRLVEQARQRKTDAQADADAAENPIAGAKGWSAYGAFDPQERSKVLDGLGFSSQLVFPTAGVGPVLAARDDDARYAASRAYNRAIAAFCAGDPRLLAVAYVPLDDPERARGEARRAIDAGCRAVMVSSGPAGERSPGHPLLDPFWALLTERDVPFMLHIGAGTKTQPKAFRNNGRERAPDLHGGGENLRFCDYIMLWYAPQVFLTALIYDGVLERFPLLRGGVIESGAGWVPDFLRQLDLAYKSFSRTDPYLKQLSMKPSDYVRRAIKFTPFPGEEVGLMIRDAGPELFMFSSDYPHPEGTKDPLGRFERTLEGIDEPTKQKFYSRNFEVMMGIGAAAPGP